MLKENDIVEHKKTGYIGRVTFISEHGLYVHVNYLNSRTHGGATVAYDELTKIGEMKA